jgi:pyridinium-3,5-biscarboxylic acid mononucleotide synthase
MGRWYKELGFSKVDVARTKIKGHPEVIYCPGKRTEQILKIAAVLQEKKQPVLATRANKKIFSMVKKRFEHAQYFEEARIVSIPNGKKVKRGGRIAVLTAGTGDIPVAEEAAVTAEIMGSRVERVYDVGVAGLHRLMRNIKQIRNARAIIVVAGMEGALASVVAGLVRVPVIAVPTRIGYGANFRGIAPLLTMINSCAPGVAVVNIDNGFGAGYLAHMINR